MATLEEMIPYVRKVTIRGEEIEIVPVKVKQLAQVSRGMAPLKEIFETKSLNRNAILSAAFSHADDIARLTCICIGKPEDYMDDCDVDELVDTFVAVLEVNLDFFTRHVFPSVSRGMAAILRGGKQAGIKEVPLPPKDSTGQPPSNSSSEQATG